jgi:flagellar protein FlgJ
VSINPPSDIVLDVARAADPARSVAATERLAQMAPSSEAADANFSNVLSELRTPRGDPVGLRTQLELSSVHEAANSQAVDAHTKAYRGVEALVLRNLVENMLPTGEDFFGEGTAGMIWRSMMADQLGNDLAKKVDLGIGKKHVGQAHAAALHKTDATAPIVSPVGVPLQNRS